jgi:hypothetical protein
MKTGTFWNGCTNDLSWLPLILTCINLEWRPIVRTRLQTSIEIGLGLYGRPNNPRNQSEDGDLQFGGYCTRGSSSNIDVHTVARSCVMYGFLIRRLAFVAHFL